MALVEAATDQKRIGIAGYAAWSREDYPDPSRDAEKCRTNKSFRLCDPDKVLNKKQLERIDEYLAIPKYVPTDMRCLSTASDKEGRMEIQVAVAIAKEVRMFCYSRGGKC